MIHIEPRVEDVRRCITKGLILITLAMLVFSAVTAVVGHRQPSALADSGPAVVAANYQAQASAETEEQPGWIAWE